VPTGSDRLYALGNNGQIITSSDRGQTWSKCAKPSFDLAGSVMEADVQCIAASPAAPDVLFAGAQGVHGAGIYKSADAGQTWTRPTKKADVKYERTGEPLDYSDEACEEIAVDPGMPNIVYARFRGFALQSNDGGVEFYDCLGFSGGEGPATRETLPIKVAHPGSIIMDPAMPNLGYLRAENALYRTGDSGRHWSKLTIPGVDFVNTIALHPGSPQIVYAATDKGIYVSQDAGRTWTAVQSADAPKTSGGFTIPYYWNGTAFNSVATVVSKDEPVIIDPQSGHLLYGTASGVRILIGVKAEKQ
jgi:hypothetical protein